ncbi:MAG: amidohydrolase family protein [Planctomycetaceae bacterium]|nr:amidohydrolase family protein [Planctomycetaceae bacterium]
MKLIDLQVNGYMGVDFSSPQLTESDFIYACQKMIKHGVTAFLPTIITSSENVYKRNLSLIAKASEKPELKEHILGIHAEGPFISKESGAVGAHNPKWTKKTDIDFLKKMQEWANGKIKILTMAAELQNADKLCKYACKNNISVFLGHQNAQLNDLERLADAGAKAVTHLGNGMPNMVNRHDNMLQYGLACDKLAATIITDGHHLPAHLIKTIIRAKGVDKVTVISDASPIAGMPPGKYNVLENETVLEKNGYLHNPKKKCMVGSSATLVECLKYLNKLNILTSRQIKKVVYNNPLQLIS